jgi:alpha-tubulin suppressor-like RCC1 family protein
MDFVAGAACSTAPRRRWSVLIVAAMLAAMGMSIAAPAQAAPNTAKAWGSNKSGQLGDGTTEGPEKCIREREVVGCSASPVEVGKLSGVTAISAGGGFQGAAHSLALLENGTVMAWGENGRGQLGNGTETSSDVPVAVKELTGVTAISAGGEYSLALLKNGKVMAWGGNFRGDLGNGTTERSNVPVRVCAVGTVGPCPTGPYLEGVTAIAAGGDEDHSLAVSNGTVVAWGANEGELGNGTEAPSNVPVRVCAVGTVGPCPTGPYLEGVTSVSASDAHSLALLGNGTVVAWGDNRFGELGTGTETKSNVPVAVSLPSVVSAIVAGGLSANGGNPYSLALLSNGEVMAWGNNEYGQLGDGTSTGPEMCGTFHLPCSKTPTLVGGLTGVTVTAIAGRGDRGLALLSTGAVMAWGQNNYGQLGNGSTIGPESCAIVEPTACSTKPVEVTKLSDVKGMSAGDDHSLAFGPPPVVTAVKPKQGSVNGGKTVTITGTDLTAATAVKFGSTNAASFTVNSPTSITVESPAEPAGRVDVTVTTTWGTSPISSADRFTFRPAVTKVTPDHGSSAGGTSVTVTGTGFALGTTATKFGFGSAKASSVNCTSTTTCTVVTPAHEVGTVDVKAMVNKVSSPTNRPGDQFTYV